MTTSNEDKKPKISDEGLFDASAHEDTNGVDVRNGSFALASFLQ